MESSRRSFLKKSLVACGSAALSSAAAFCVSSRRSSRRKANERKEPGYLHLERSGRLARIEEELWEMLSRCRLCPRGCDVNRLGGKQGACGSDGRLKVSSAFPHTGEEQPLTGQAGSGTVFFSNCNLLCCFCQNWKIAHLGEGTFISHDRLARVMLSLQKRGCHNINLVTPTHVVPHIVKALRLAVPMGLRLPLVYNTGGYDSIEVIRLLDGIVDIYLPDFKYQSGDHAYRYSSIAHDYPQVASAAIAEMNRQVGPLVTDDAGVAVRGLMVRHLVMPNNIAGTNGFSEWAAQKLGRTVYINLMSQYRPEHMAFLHPEIARRPTRMEMIQAVEWTRQARLQRVEL